jgi:hypothetical protein
MDLMVRRTRAEVLRPDGRTRRGWAAVAAGSLSLALFAACSGPGGNAPGGNDQPGGAGNPSASAAPSSAPAKSLPKGVKPAQIPTKVANDPADRKNVVMTTCEAAKGGWQASGTATNPGKDDADYEITVFFTTTAATTIDSARTDVSVKAGETVKWSAKKEFTAPKEMLCVLRGVAAG